MSIIIISNNNDQSTSDVINWLIFLGHKVIRINDAERINLASARLTEDSDIELKVKDELLNLKEVSSFWYRRGYFSFFSPELDYDDQLPFKSAISAHLQGEKRKLRDYLLYKLQAKRSLGDFFNVDVNKLVVLDVAKKLGLIVPDTLITTRKAELISFKKKHGEIITKAISEAILLTNELGSVHNYTEVVTDEIISRLPETFFLSQFQKKIAKKYELRVFYLSGDFYSMAIFSQSDDQTRTDFRKYNWQKPNRCVPYCLPNDLKEKLQELMVILNLNTGSIDLAVTEDQQYVFFEINPVGQYGMTSRPCNYFLDRKIANLLIKKDYE